ncbi:MAG: hypothetical protein WDN69_11615 [Aliidongia sp.]
MTKPPDLEDLARRYVELWQDQIAAAAADPELTDALVRMMQVAGSGLAASTAMWQNFWAGTAARYTAPPGEGLHTYDGNRHYPSAWATPAPGPAPAAGASPVGGDDLAQLHARLAVLEERLAAVETGPRPARRRPRKRTRRNDTP